MALYKAKNGSKYSEENVMAAAKKAGVSLDEFISNKNLQKIEEEAQNTNIAEDIIIDVPEDNVEVDTTVDVIEPPKKKKKKSTATAATKQVSTALDSPYLNKNLPDPLGLNKIIQPIKVEQPAPTKVKPKIPNNTLDNNPTRVNLDFFKRKDPSWYQGNTKDEDEVKAELQLKLGKDFVIEDSFLPGIDQINIYSNTTGKRTKFAWGNTQINSKGQEVIDLAGNDNISSLNKWLFENSRYTNSEKTKKEKAEYKASGNLSYDDALAAADRSRNWWKIAKEAGSYLLSAGSGQSIVHANNIKNLWEDPGKYEEIFPENATDDQKVSAVRKISVKVQQDANKILEQQVLKSNAYARKGLSGMVNGEREAQEFYDTLIEKNKDFIYKSGFDESIIKKFFANRVKELAEIEKTNFENLVKIETDKKSLDENLKISRQYTYSQLPKEQLPTAYAWEAVDRANEELFKLRSNPKYIKGDPSETNKEEGLERTLAEAKRTAVKLSSEGNKYNNYFYDPATSKIAYVQTKDVNLDQENTVNISQKVLSFKEMYHGTTKEALAEKFVKTTAEKRRSDLDGNKKVTVSTSMNKVSPWEAEILQKAGATLSYDREKNTVVISNVPIKSLSNYTDRSDFRVYDNKTKKAGGLLNGQIETWKNRNSELMAKYAAINDLYILNRAPSSELTNPIGYLADGFVKAINPEYQGARDKISVREQVAEEAGVKLTKKEKLNIAPGSVEEIATATGSMIPTVAKIAAVTAITEGAGTAVVGEEALAAFAALRTGTFAQKALYHTSMALKEEAQMRLAGLGPTSGSAFYVSGRLMPKAFRPFTESWGRAGNNLTNFTYHAVKGGVQMDIAGFTENAYDAINHDKDFQAYLNENYKDAPTWFRKTMGNAISFGFMGSTQLASKFGRKAATKTFASGNQINEATNVAGEAYTKAEQDLNNYKENTPSTDKNYKSNLKKYEKALEKAKFDYTTLSHLNNAWQQNEALKTDDGLKDYIQKENKNFFDQYYKQYGQTIDISVSSDANAKTSFTPPKIDPKTNQVVENAKITINRNTAAPGGIFNKGKVAHELSHAMDWQVKQEKMQEYSKVPITVKDANGVEETRLPNKQEIALYGNKLDAEKNQKVIDILVKNFPDLMNDKRWQGANYTEANKALQEFKKTADPNSEGYTEKLNKLTEALEAQRMNVIDAVKSAYEKKLVNGKVINPAEVNDEIIKRVIEELADRSGNNITSNTLKARGFFKGAAIDFANLLNKNNKVNYEIKDANELLELLNNYAQSVRQGGGASFKYSDALARLDLTAIGDIEAKEVDLDNEAAIKRYDNRQKKKQDLLNEKEAELNAPETKESKDLQKQLDALDEKYESGEEDMDYDAYEAQRNNILDKIEAENRRAVKAIPVEKTIEKKIATEEENVKEIIRNEKGSVSSNKVQDLYDANGVDAAPEIINLFKPITKKIVDKRRDAPGFDRDLLTDEVETGEGGILYLIKSYKPEKGVPLAAYINKQLPLRAIAASRRLLDAEFKADVAEQKALMADEAFAAEKEKASYKNTLDSKVFGADVVKNMTDNIITIARTIKSRIDEPVSLNKTVTPFISEIRDEVGKQLDIIVKKEMGGKKDNELRKWLLKNKRYTLENMTTTWMMGKDMGKEVQGGMPIAIQKRVDGKWLNYPEWVGKTPDREAVSTDNAGRTAGHYMVRRLPNAWKIISDADYLAQVIGPDGNPLRGRKESLAKAISEESAFDIINNDLATQGPIYEAIITNQERRGVVIAENFVAEVARQAERGNVKQSMDLTKAERNLIDIINNPDALTRYNIFNYINDRSYKGLDKDIKEKLDKGIDELSTAYENKITAFQDRERKGDIELSNDTFYKKYKTAEKTYVDFDTYFSEFQKNKLETKEVLLGIKDKTFERIDKPENRKNFAEVKDRLKTFAVESLGIKGADGKVIKDFSKLPEENKKQALENVKDLLDVIKMPLAGATEAAGWMFGELGTGAIKGNKDLFDSLNLEQYGYTMPGKSIIKDPNGQPVTSYLESQRSSAKDIVNSLKEGKDIYSKEKRDSDSDKLRKATLRFLENLKNNDMSAEAKATLIVFLGKHINGPFRGMAKLDTVLPSLEGGKYEFEHAKPISLTVQEAIAYATGLPLHGEFINTIEALDTRFQENVVSMIPKGMADLVNVINKSTSPYKLGGDVYDRYTGKRMQDYLATNGWIVNRGDFVKIEGNGKKIPGINFAERLERYKEQNSIDAVQNSLDLNKERKGISVFDFDDTVGLTKSNVLYTMPDGKTGKLNGAEFAKNGSKLLSEGAVFDFSEFSKVVDGKPGPMVEKMKKMIGKFGPENFFILTARPADSAVPIHQFLKSIGIDIPLENITGLGNSAAQAKADWMVEKAAKGYNDFYFADDAIQNVTAVKNALDVLDVKSKIQQAKEKFSLDLSKEFNNIIEANTGMENYKVFSDVVARRRGSTKNKFDLYVPPSAADFELLLYNFMGKGAEGEAQKKFFGEALLKPYANGNDLMDAARQSIKKDYKSLINQFPNIKKELEKLTPDGDYTYDQAIRVAMWTGEGVEIPGISQRDQRKLTDLVNNNPELNAFKQGLITTGRQGKGWVAPTEYWDSSTIISDLHNLTEGEGRKKFLGEFIDNYEKIFGTWENGKLIGPNMNKVEAVYGTNVREALEDSLYRMTNGKNRSYGKDKETSRWSNWVNGSTGTIMFLNTRSAALQLLGAVNFFNFRDNNPIAAGKAFANQKQYWADFARIWNSDKMKERRGGLKEDVAAAEIANAAAGSKNKVNAVISYLLKVGYTPTQLADSFAIASGGAPFYRNRIKSYLKEGQTQTEAEANAWSDFTKVSDETQQSGDPRDISKQQASPAGRLLLTFQNFSMQQARIVKKAVLDLKNGRGDAKTNVSKIVYYLTVQNVLFAGLQQGLFATFFDDDDQFKEEDQKTKPKIKTNTEKALSLADDVLDTILRGTGFLGGITATLKNMYLKYRDEKEKDFKADYAKVVLEGANISPPIGSKLRKVYSGLQQTKFERDLIKERGWGVMQDGRVHLGPMYGVTGKFVEAGTNFPMDRLVNKIENVSQAMNSQNKAWQRVAVGMGWTPYSVGIEESKGDQEIRAKAKEERKEAGKTKRKQSSQEERDSIANLSPDAYMDFVKKRKEAREKKRDSIANLPPAEKEAYLKKKEEESNARKREKEALKKIKADSIANLSPAEKAKYDKKVAEEKAQKKKERREKYLEKKKALQDSLAGLSPREREKYKAKKKAERHEYYMKNKKPSKKKANQSDIFI